MWGEIFSSWFFFLTKVRRVLAVTLEHIENGYSIPYMYGMCILQYMDDSIRDSKALNMRQGIIFIERKSLFTDAWYIFYVCMYV